MYMYMSMCGICHGGANRYNYLENKPKTTAISKLRQVYDYNLIFTNAVLDKALVSQDTSHPAHDLFEPLPSSRRFRSIKTRTNRFSTSFFPLAI